VGQQRGAVDVDELLRRADDRVQELRGILRGMPRPSDDRAALMSEFTSLMPALATLAELLLQIAEAAAHQGADRSALFVVLHEGNDVTRQIAERYPQLAVPVPSIEEFFESKSATLH
jgi:hypothetical protein